MRILLKLLVLRGLILAQVALQVRRLAAYRILPVLGNERMQAVVCVGALHETFKGVREPDRLRSGNLVLPLVGVARLRG